MNSLTPKTAPSGILPCVGVRVPTGYVTKAPAWSPISVTPHSSVAQTAGPQVADASVSPTSSGFSNVFVRGASFFPLWQLCSEEVCDHSFGISSRTSNVHDGRKGNNCFCSAVAAATCVLAVIQGPPAGSTASAWQRLLSLLTGRGGGARGLQLSPAGPSGSCCSPRNAVPSLRLEVPGSQFLPTGKRLAFRDPL